ncbi:MAG TPA: polyprenyl synthetase family protein [Flavobacteriales bacterium]
MKSIQELQELVAKKVDGFCRKNGDAPLFQPINYIMQLGGKRMRPVLSLMAANLFSDDIEQAVYPAIAIEVFHNFTLMHDDIMDNSPLRRGQPTVHHKWNPNAAILSGDTMLVQSYQLLIKTYPEKIAPVMELYNRTAIEVCIGQQRDMEFEKRAVVSVDEYLDMIRLKTSVLVGGAMQIGAMINGASEQDQQLVYEFGESLGMAFQLHDDLLDVFGDIAQTGKQIGGDIIADKKTFLLIRAFEKAGEREAAVLKKYIGNRSHADSEKVEAVKEVYLTLGLKDELLELAESYFLKSMAALDKISVDAERKTQLRELATQLQSRKS